MVNILRLIYRDFASLVLIGFLLAIPLSYYVLNTWLLNFNYRASMDVGIYLVSLIVVVTTVTLTIGYQAVRASMANPVKSLRSD